ncbi:WG repeat-containing protein [Maribacter thermophilus]|uniref:WG repeat-containing protein n=1 Tax=Maribacter thermophilus TaxID=1197874 RepID=UPI0006416D73|nr:WG repeat-containing protein [Maribacter thermophilus]
MKNSRKLWGLIVLMFTTALSAQTIGNIDEIAPFSEGLAAVRQGEQWGFINDQGTLVIDFRDDIYWNKNADLSKEDVAAVKYPVFNEGLCMIVKKVEDGVPVFGFINNKGETVIEPQFLNIYPFENGVTTGVLFDKTFRGENEFKLKIYDYKFFDVMVNTQGEITDYFEKRDHIQMTVKRYKMPDIGAKILNKGLVAIHKQDKGWEIRKLDTKN